MATTNDNRSDYLIVEKKDDLYCRQSPIVVSYRLAKHKPTGAMGVALQFRNLSNKVIIAVYASVSAYGPAKEQLRGVNNFQYLDVNATQEAVFGGTTRIAMPDLSTRHVAIHINKVVFSDASVWEPPADVVWDPIPQQQPIDDHFKNEDLAAQYRMCVKDHEARFMPQKYEDLILCKCGKVSKNGEMQCPKCGIQFAELFQLTDDDVKTAYEKRRDRKRKIIKRIIKSVLYVAAVALVIAAAVIVIKDVIGQKDTSKGKEQIQAEAIIDTSKSELSKGKPTPGANAVSDEDIVAQAIDSAQNAAKKGNYDDAIQILNNALHQVKNGSRLEQLIKEYELAKSQQGIDDVINNAEIAAADGDYNEQATPKTISLWSYNRMNVIRGGVHIVDSMSDYYGNTFKNVIVNDRVGEYYDEDTAVISFNLNGNFKRLTGEMFRNDVFWSQKAEYPPFIRIYCDSNNVVNKKLGAESDPFSFDIDLTAVKVLRIEFDTIISTGNAAALTNCLLYPNTAANIPTTMPSDVKTQFGRAFWDYALNGASYTRQERISYTQKAYENRDNSGSTTSGYYSRHEVIAGNWGYEYYYADGILYMVSVYNPAVNGNGRLLYFLYYWDGALIGINDYQEASGEWWLSPEHSLFSQYSQQFNDVDISSYR